MRVLLITRVVEQVHEVAPFESAVDLLGEAEGLGRGVDALGHGW